MAESKSFETPPHQGCRTIDLALKRCLQIGFGVGGPVLKYLQLILHTSDKQDKEKSALSDLVILAERLRTFQVLVRQDP
jgi:hypothetical protein